MSDLETRTDPSHPDERIVKTIRPFRDQRTGIIIPGRRSTDGTRGEGVGRRSTFATLRQSPIRNGLVGLAFAGTAAPIVLNRYMQALRTDPSHAVYLTQRAGLETGDGIGGVWSDLELERDVAETQRDSVVSESLRQYAEFPLTRDLAEEIYDVALEHEIDPDVAFGLVRAESSFRNASTSPVGAVGLTQLMPRTAAWLEPGVTPTQLRESATNLRIGFTYLRSLIEKYGGNTDLALVAYNRGPGTVDREIERGRDPDNGYSAFVRGLENHGHSLYTSR